MKLDEVSMRRKAVFSLMAGILISFCYVAGASLDRYDSLDMRQGSFYGKWILAAAAVSFFIYGVWEGLRRLEGRFRNSAGGAWNNRIGMPVCMALMLLCWLPALLSIFPGVFAYDALDEWQQVRGWALTSHHPVIHVLALGGSLEVVHGLTGSYNAGIAFYTILQMLLFAWLLALSIRMLWELGRRLWLCVLALAFFCLSPVVQLFSVCATKDVIFSAAELLLILYLFFFYCKPEVFWKERRKQAGFVLAAFFTMILRNNGRYIVLGTLAVMAFSCRRHWRKALWLLAGILLPYLLYIGPCYRILGVEPGGVEEMLSVPLQQAARVYRYDREALSEEDVALLESFMAKESLEGYRATVSDFVKKDFRREFYTEHKSEFWKMWARLGAEHPMTYLNSFFIGTVDFWYPHAVMDGYRHADGRGSYFDYQVEEPGTEIVLLEKAHRYYEAISHDTKVQSLPFVFLALNPGTYLLLFFTVFLYLWCYKRYRLLMPLVVLVLHFGTVLLGPVALARYVLTFFLAFPLCVGAAVTGGAIEGEKGMPGKE